MTKDAFKIEFRRLCDGFEYKPRPAQVDAFYERLQHCHIDDWRQAVTDLLCSPYFPKTVDVILEAIEKRAEDRRRGQQGRERCRPVLAGRSFDSTTLQQACEEDPERMAPLLRILGRA